MNEHAQSTLDDARAWREVKHALIELGFDPLDITPEWVVQKIKRQTGFGVDYFSPENSGWKCYEDVYR